LWRMLYETAARSAEMLALDVEDLDLLNRRAKVRRKGGAADVIVWQTGTARLLSRLLKDRKSGLVFITERKVRVQLPRPTWTSAVTPGSATSKPRRCSLQPPAEPRCTSSGTAPSLTTRTAPGRRC
jgi:integrase